MKTTPILFSTPMVQAILNNTKTQTRRVVKPQPELIEMKFTYFNGCWAIFETPLNHIKPLMYHAKKKANIGDIFWVRETFQESKNINDLGYDEILYKADEWKGVNWKWKPSIFMPKTVCRIFLEVTNVRVERLQDISEDDAKAEGVLRVSNGFSNKWFKDYLKSWSGHSQAKDSFRTLWHSINGEKSWNDNPFVWVYDFKVVEKPENFLK